MDNVLRILFHIRCCQVRNIFLYHPIISIQSENDTNVPSCSFSEAESDSDKMLMLER